MNVIRPEPWSLGCV